MLNKFREFFKVVLSYPFIFFISYPFVFYLFSLKKKEFVIISNPRSGSTHLRLLLNSHPMIESYGEVFMYGFQILKFFISVFRNIFKKSSLKRVLSFKKNSTLCGFKILYHQFRYTPLIEFIFLRDDIKVIHILRRNLLRIYISHIIAKKTQQWCSYSETSLRKISVGCGGVIKELEGLKSRQGKYCEKIKNNDVIEIYYEDLIKNTKKVLKDVQKFLGVPVEKLSSNLVKQNPYKISEMVENYDELEETLKGTKYEWMLTAD